jgi:RimJ/RimL family protein N-acetyltransferase
LPAEVGEAVGFVTLGACHDTNVDQKTTGEIYCIYLAPTHWRKGLGTLLCRFAEETLRARGYGTVTLWVFAGNARGTCFYEAVGYVADGATKVLDVGAPLEVVRYRRALLDARRSALQTIGGHIPHSQLPPATWSTPQSGSGN